MAHKRVMFRSAAREKILRGAAQLADAIRVTLGPKSKSVLIQRKWGAPIVCNDGVTIAKEFDSKATPKKILAPRFSAKLLRKPVKLSATAPARRRFSRMQFLRTEFATWSLGAVQSTSSVAWIVVSKPRSMRSKPCPVPSRRAKRRRRLGRFQLTMDEAVGELVADAMEKVGGDGAITVEESKTTETTLELVEGMQFDRGFLSPYFITDSERIKAVLEDPYILLSGLALA